MRRPMGFWMFFFDHDRWYNLYEKNCSLRTQEEWFSEGHPDIPLGLVYLITAVFFELTYIPFLIVMIRKEFFQYSCYKLMFMMGILDVLILPFNGVITGVQVMRGAHFCNSPKLFYFTGAIGVWGFYGVATICVILAFDRFLEMCFPKIAVRVFGGKTAYFWMCAPILYQCYTGFQLPHVFNIKVYAMHYDPYHLIPKFEKNTGFDFEAFRTFFAINNSMLILLLFLFYGGLVLVLKIQSSLYNMPSISNVQKQMTYQTLCICGEIFLSPLLHICMLFIEFPVAVEIIAHFSWICLHGDTPIIYFILNSSLRKAVLKMLPPLGKLKTRVQTITHSISHRSSNAVASVSQNVA